MQHQISTYTEPDRYPEIFKAVSTLVNDTEQSILSFGCSEGEEIVSILKYIPNSFVYGVDINDEILSKAVLKCKDLPVKIQKYMPTNIDVAFCMSVFCRWTDTEVVDDCSNIYTFADFESGLDLVLSSMKSGGLIVVYNSNFRIHDTNHYKLGLLKHIDVTHESGFVKKFGPDNKVLPDQTYNACIFKYELIS